jgi:hypothetical protein
LTRRRASATAYKTRYAGRLDRRRHSTGSEKTLQRKWLDNSRCLTVAAEQV